MKKRIYGGFAACLLALTLTGCGEQLYESETSVESKFQEESVSGAPVQESNSIVIGEVGDIFADSQESGAGRQVVDDSDIKDFIRIALPTKDLHTSKNIWYDKLISSIEAHTGQTVEWVWYDTNTYNEQILADIQAGTVADIVYIDRSESFLEAAVAGQFWEIGEYIDVYDNLATIGEECRLNGSYNGKMYGIASEAELAKGLVYRADWLEKLGLQEPMDWESFCKMLEAFTYQDPDGNGIDDTVGLVMDEWGDYWDVMECWFGVPHIWGIDENGDLVHKSRTQQYKDAYAAFRELYAKGLINSGINNVPEFRELKRDMALRQEFNDAHGGSTVTSLYNSCSMWKDWVEEGLISEDAKTLALLANVETGQGDICYSEYGNDSCGMLAITTNRVSNEEELKVVLQFINDLFDGEVADWMANGWEGLTYILDEKGYLEGIFPEEDARGYMTFNVGFSPLNMGHVAEVNQKIRLASFQGMSLWKARAELISESVDKGVLNYGYQFMSAEDIEKLEELDTLLLDAEFKYVAGEVDDVGFAAALNSWWENGGEQMTKDINEQYHAAGY